MKLERMLGILSVLLQRGKVTAPYLAQKFEVSRRTISRDIEALCAAGIPVVTQAGQGGGISLMEGYRIDRTLLTTAELQAILTGLRSLDSVSNTNRYAQLMEKLSAGSSELLTADTHILIDLASWYKASLAPKIELLHSAIRMGRRVSFVYCAPKGESRRTVEPFYLVFQWASWYLWGWCESRRDFRLFKLGRMEALTVGDAFEKRAVPLPDLSAERVFPAVHTVRAKVQPQYKWRLVEEFGAQCYTVQPDGSLLFSAGFTDRDSVIRWIVSFGGGAQLLEPAALRAEVAAFARDILKNYPET